MHEDGLILEPDELVGYVLVGSLDLFDLDGDLIEEGVAVHFEVDSLEMAEKLVSLVGLNVDWIEK